MRLDPPDQRRQHRAAGAHLVGQGRQAERHALPGIAFGLAVQRLMLPELLEQDHRQQAGTGPAAGDHMERRRRLADLLAIAAGELLANVLDHLPLPRNDLQRLGDVLAQLAQPRAAAAQASGRSRLDHPLARQMLGEGLARRALAGEGHHIGGLGHGPLGGDLVLGRRTLELLEGQLHLIEQSHAAFRALAVELARQLGDLQLLMGDQGLIVGSLGLGHRQFGLDPGRPGPSSMRLRAPISAACSAAMSSGRSSGVVVTSPIIPYRRARALLNHRVSRSRRRLSRPPPDARCEPGSASRSRRAYRPTAPR